MPPKPCKAPLVREIQVTTSPRHQPRCGGESVVADTGHGVTQELKEKLFLPYFSTKKRGTGLGLAIVSRIIEDHRGSIRVEENKPVGTRFIVELPPRSLILLTVPHRPSMHNILIVDDESGIRDSLPRRARRRWLTDRRRRKWRSLPRTARASRAFDVVLLDVWLPGIDGLDTLEKIRALDNHSGSHHDLRPRHH